MPVPHATRARAGPIVLLHGFTQCGDSWDAVRRSLGGAGVFTPDLPGHGAFAHRRPVSFDACVAYLRALPHRRFVLCGYSMGGRVALYAALALPDRVSRLVLVSATAGIEDPAARQARADADAELAARIRAVGIEQFSAEWGASPLFADLPRGIAGAAQAIRRRQSADGLAAALLGLGTGVMPPLWRRLHEVTIPAAILVGEQDAKFREHGASLVDGLPQGQLHVIAGVGHALHLTRPDAVASALRDED